MSDPIDLDRLRRALDRADKLAERRPDLVHPGPPSAADIEELEADLAENDKPLNVRIPEPLLARLDSYVHNQRAFLTEVGMPANYTRSDAVRTLLAKALENAEPNRGE